jgi:6-phosphogluconolactonase
MKFRKLRQLAVVSGIGLGVATLFSGCQLVTIDYLFVATSASTVSGSSTTCPGGEIETYAIDSQSGAIRNGAPAVCSGGTTPTVLAISPGYQNLYVANQADKNIVHFSVAANGVLSKKDTATLTDPVTALTVSPDGNSLYVLSGTSAATLSVFGLSSGALGSAPESQAALTIPGNATDLVVPTAITVLPSGKAVYATAYDKSSYNPGGTTTSSANPGWLYGFAVGSGGALTPTPGSPYNAGVKPSGIAAEATNSYLYVTDFASNQMIGYGVYSGFAVNFLLNGPYRSGGQPTAVAIDPRGRFIYISNSLDSTVGAYVIDLQTGTPSSAVNTTGS